jgi:hypothetical protein
MDASYRNKSAIGLSIGMGLFLAGMALIFTHVRGQFANFDSIQARVGIAMLDVSVPFYLWGCASLALGKGYSRAILLTCILGWLLPAVILLVLPDKNRRRRKWK